MFYILQTIAGARIKVTKEQREKIIQTIDSGATHISVNGSYLLTSTIASIIPADEYIASKNAELNGKGQYMCAHGKIHHNESYCDCTRDTRLAPGSLITAAKRLECPQCHTLSPYDAEHPHCESCDASLVLPSKEPVHVLPEPSSGSFEKVSVVAKRMK